MHFKTSVAEALTYVHFGHRGCTKGSEVLLRHETEQLCNKKRAQEEKV